MGLPCPGLRSRGFEERRLQPQRTHLSVFPSEAISAVQSGQAKNRVCQEDVMDTIRS